MKFLNILFMIAPNTGCRMRQQATITNKGQRS